MTDVRRVNAALKRIGAEHRIVRNLRGGTYYYFTGGAFEVASIYSYTLRGYSTDDVVEHYRIAAHRHATEGSQYEPRDFKRSFLQKGAP